MTGSGIDEGDAPAFVLGLGAGGYGVVRCLAAAGRRVVGFYDQEDHLGRFSRHCASHPLPPVAQARAVCNALIAAARRFTARPVLFPTADRFASLLADHRNELAEHFAFHWVSPSTIVQIIDKSRVVELCERAAVDYPRTHLTSPGERVEEVLSSFTFPVLVKPVRSFDTEFPPGWKTFLARTPEAMHRFYREHPKLLGSTIWQQVVAGPDHEVYQCNLFIRSSGTVAGVSTVRKLRQDPPGFGHMCYGRTEPNEAVVEQSLRFLRELDYHGLASLEFKLDSRHGRLYFIEMNPRMPWYNVLLRDADINLPDLAYRDLVSPAGTELPAMSQRNGAHWICFVDDLRHYLTLQPDSRPDLLHWLASIVRARSFAWWDWRDPGPWLRVKGKLLGKALRRAGGLLRKLR